MVLMNMEAAVITAVRGHARSHDLAESVDIVGLDSKILLNLASHPLRPGLRPI